MPRHSRPSTSAEFRDAATADPDNSPRPPRPPLARDNAAARPTPWKEGG